MLAIGEGRTMLAMAQMSTPNWVSNDNLDSTGNYELGLFCAIKFAVSVRLALRYLREDRVCCRVLPTFVLCIVRFLDAPTHPHTIAALSSLSSLYSLAVSDQYLTLLPFSN